MKSKIYLIDKKIWKITSLASLWHQIIILELNKYNPTLLRV